MPNLQVLHFGKSDLQPTYLLPTYLSQLISSLRHNALLELILDTDWEPVEGPPTTGLTGLEKLSIGWNAHDNSNEPGSSLAHLYEFIRPTLTTLVELKMDNGLLGDFDLQLLKPAADTLRTFKYTLLSADENILYTIPAILPRLIKLSIKWENTYTVTKHSILWKACTIFFYCLLNDINKFCRTRTSKLSRKTITLLT